MPTPGQTTGGGALMSGPLLAAADLSAQQYKFVVLSAAGQVNVASTGGARAIGILQNKPRQGEAAQVIYEGESFLVAGGTINIGDMLKTDTSGRGVSTTTATDIVCAMALEAASAAGDIIRVRVFSPRPYG